MCVCVCVCVCVCAAEDKSRTAFVAPDASMVLSILMAMHHTVGGRLPVLFRGLRTAEEPFTDGAGIPIGASYWYGGSFSHTALRARTLCPFQGAIAGAIKPEEPLGGYMPLSVMPDMGHIPRAFATILSIRCVLFARGGVAAALPGRSPSTTPRCAGWCLHAMV